MRIIYTYIVREILWVTLATVCVLTLMLVIANVFKEVFDLLLLEEVSLWTIFKMVILLVPFVLPITLPWGILMGVLLVFGRLAQEKELMALKASGIGLAPIVAPAIILSLFFSAFSFWINASVGPECRNAYREIASDIVSNNPTAFFTTGTLIDRFPGVRIWIGQKHGARVEDIYLWQVDENMNPIRSLRADRGKLEPDLAKEELSLHLSNVRQVERDALAPTDISKIHAPMRADDMVFPISLSAFMDRVKIRSAGRLTFLEIQKVLSDSGESRELNPTPFLTEIQKRIASSLSCFTFVLVGIPLAIQTQRREMSVGVALSLAVVLAYYGGTVLAEALKRHATLYPEVIIWAPNIVFQILGFYLLWRANKR